MKKLFILIAFLLPSALMFSQFQIRIAVPGSSEPGIFRVQMRCTQAPLLPTTGLQCYDLSFRIWWPNGLGVADIDVNTPATYGAALTEGAPIAGTEAGGGTPNGLVAPIAFCSSCNPFNFPANWVLNQWVNVATINICSNADCAGGTYPAGVTGSSFRVQMPYQFFPNFLYDNGEFTPLIGPLPLQLLSFRADKSGTKDALISWATTNEENTRNFVVERSFDKKSWAKIGSVTAAGYSLGVEQYSFTDIGVYNGRDNKLTAYYRIQMVDQDSYAKTSPIESVIFGNSGTSGKEFAVYPNPASDGIQIEWDGNLIDQPTSVEFFDVDGKLVYTQKVSENTDQQYVDFSHTTILPGMYLLRILSGEIALDFKQIVVGQR